MSPSVTSHPLLVLRVQNPQVLFLLGARVAPEADDGLEVLTSPNEGTWSRVQRLKYTYIYI